MPYTPAENLPPVDPNVPIPAAVTAAAAQANSLHAAVYAEPAPPQPVAAPAPFTPDPQIAPAVTAPVTPQPAPEPQPQPAPEPQPQPAPEPQPDQNVDWQARYNAMKGRFDQSQGTIHSMQEQMSELGNELIRTQQTVHQRQVQQPQVPEPLLTPEDEKTFGPELIDVIKRAAQSAVQPVVTDLTTRQQRLGQQFQRTAEQTLFGVLDSDMPEWRAINTNPRFKQWLALRDLYSGGVKRELLMDAFRRADAPRVLAFFKSFVTDEQATGQMSAPQPGAQDASSPLPRAPAVSLTTLSTPGRAHPGGDTSAPSDKPVFQRSDIRWFYSNEGMAAYYGRPDARKADEQRIFEAQRDGRVR